MKRLTINDLDFSIATICCLRAAGIETPEALLVVAQNPNNLLRIPNVGRTRLKEIMAGVLIATKEIGQSVKPGVPKRALTNESIEVRALRALVEKQDAEIKTIRGRKPDDRCDSKHVELLLLMESARLISVPDTANGFCMSKLRREGFASDKAKLREAIASGDLLRMSSVGPITTAEACWWLIYGTEENANP